MWSSTLRWSSPPTREYIEKWTTTCVGVFTGWWLTWGWAFYTQTDEDGRTDDDCNKHLQAEFKSVFCQHQKLQMNYGYTSDAARKHINKSLRASRLIPPETGDDHHAMPEISLCSWWPPPSIYTHYPARVNEWWGAARIHQPPSVCVFIKRDHSTRGGHLVVESRLRFIENKKDHK